ncbi:hypothetical protein ACTXGQ_12095 [Marinobacter sp. 1Y8]
MLIEIVIPETLPEGRRSSFKKGIVDALLKASTTDSEYEHTPEGHEKYRKQGEKVGEELSQKIQASYPK